MDILKLERRYNVFDEKTFSRLLKLLKTMTTYSLDEPEKIKLVDYYYDNKENLLEKSELLLRRRVFGKKAQLKIMRRYFRPEFFYSDALRSSERELEIGAGDPLSRHYFFLNNALNSMFTNILQFDTDKMFEKMHATIIINIEQNKRVLFGYGGLKAELSQYKMKVENLITNRKNTTEIVEFKLISPENTMPLFEDLITRVERHCKELFYTKDSKYECASNITKPLMTKEEKLKLKDEITKQKELLQATEGYFSEDKK